MQVDDPYKTARGKYSRPGSETTTFDPFVTAMWEVYRNNAPAQDYSGKNFKWIWKGNSGAWIAN